jgi:hypothetical protein
MQQVVNLDPKKLKDMIEKEIRVWKDDPNYMSIFPVAIGQGEFSGRGKLLSIIDELKEMTAQIVSSLGIPLEFVMGGLNYSGSSVSLRILENDLISLRTYDEKVIQYVIEKVRALFPKLPPIKVHFSNWKFADDLSRKQLLANFAGNNLMSMDSLCKEYEFDLRNDADKRIKENSGVLSELNVSKATADIKDQAAIVRIKAEEESKLRKQMQSMGIETGPDGGDLLQMPGQDQQDQQNKAKNPQNPQESTGLTDGMSPPSDLPKQKPPRSEGKNKKL